MWRAFSNALPTLDNLWHKKVVDDPSCTRCGKKWEFVEHALFGCKAARQVWADSSFCSFIYNRRNHHLQDVLLSMAGLFNPDELGQACMLIWAVWEDRNSFVNTGKAKEPESVVARANVMLEEFKDSVQVFSPPPPIPTFRSPSDWLAPPPGQLKLNTCAAFNRISKGVGVGATIRDSKGMVLAVRSNRILGSFSKVIGHLLALREGLMLAIRLRLQGELGGDFSKY
ncbi:hypothetical protein EZV62_012221 [Acer yangbiense]|uniref:Reverse transcriptase zinc-binding domain-containing protein n=1 Tax=Acer yangbiense TaxID=1000413 RepID=A0A5C7HVP2_9ROSI|nr:hypothetical protein EZV62_012221 [Acer yangbiense]